MSLGPMLEIRVPRWADADEIAEGAVGRSFFDPGAETEPVDLDRLARRAAVAVAQGYDALKFDLDVPGLVPERPGSRTAPSGAEALATDVVDAIRDGAGPGVDLALDLHWRYDAASALRLARAVAHAPILWLEDPLPPENTAGLIALAQAAPVLLGGGENLVGHRSFEPLVAAGSLTVVTPDLGKFGGVAEARRLAAAADDRGLAVAPHNIAGPVGTAFAAQLSATWPNLLALEHHAQDVPFFAELATAPLIVDGSIAMTEEPGIGIEPDLDVARRWAKHGELFFGEELP